MSSGSDMKIVTVSITTILWGLQDLRNKVIEIIVYINLKCVNWKKSFLY